MQRPQVREAIALDVFILRFLAKQARDRLKASRTARPLGQGSALGCRNRVQRKGQPHRQASGVGIPGQGAGTGYSLKASRTARPLGSGTWVRVWEQGTGCSLHVRGLLGALSAAQMP